MAISLSALFSGNRALAGAAALLASGLVFGGVFLKGYAAGFASAADKGAAAMVRLRATLAENHAGALRLAFERAERETANALSIGSAYAREKERHAKTKRRLEKEIAHSGAHDGTARFGPEFVRVWNEAVGACGPAAANPEGKNHRAAGTSAAAGTGFAPCAGLHGGGVTARDLAAFIVYHGARSQNMEAQLNALITRIEEYNK